MNLCSSFVGIFRWHCGEMKIFTMLLGDKVPREAVRIDHGESDQMEMVAVDEDVVYKFHTLVA